MDYGFDYCILFVEWTEQLNIMVLTYNNYINYYYYVADLYYSLSWYLLLVILYLNTILLNKKISKQKYHFDIHNVRESCISPPSFHFKKGLAKLTIEVRLIRGFRQKGAFSSLSRGASYTRMRLIPEYIR